MCTYYILQSQSCQYCVPSFFLFLLPFSVLLMPLFLFQVQPTFLYPIIATLSIFKCSNSFQCRPDTLMRNFFLYPNAMTMSRKVSIQRLHKVGECAQTQWVMLSIANTRPRVLSSCFQNCFLNNGSSFKLKVTRESGIPFYILVPSSFLCHSAAFLSIS